MRAAILSIGAELLRGDIVDTNAAFLARELVALGFQVRRSSQTGDVIEDLAAELRRNLEIADVILCTGGLGPTQDDLTRDAIALTLGEEMTIDEELVEEVRGRFSLLRRQMPESNRRQALMIPSADVLHNANGTAPGWYVQRDGKTIATMPGPPKEMQPMWAAVVRPRLEQLLPGHIAMSSIMTFGLGESRVEQMIDPIIHRHPEVTVATYAKEAGVQVHISARRQTVAEARTLVDETDALVVAELGAAVIGRGDTSLAREVGRLLRERGQTLASMESCTGGTVAASVTGIDGSSDYFAGGVVTYTRDSKALHGVDVSVMNDHGLISEETARAMARAVRDRFSTSFGVSTTGIAGQEPVEGKEPGTCFVAVCGEGIDEVREVHRPGSRETRMAFFSQCALDLLRRELIIRGA